MTQSCAPSERIGSSAAVSASLSTVAIVCGRPDGAGVTAALEWKPGGAGAEVTAQATDEVTAVCRGWVSGVRAGTRSDGQCSPPGSSREQKERRSRDHVRGRTATCVGWKLEAVGRPYGALRVALGDRGPTSVPLRACPCAARSGTAQDADGWNVELAALDLEQQRVTVAEAAKRLNVSHSAIRTLCRRGLLPYGRVLNFIRLRPEDVERFMVQGRS